MSQKVKDLLKAFEKHAFPVLLLIALLAATLTFFLILIISLEDSRLNKNSITQTTENKALYFEETLHSGRDKA